jgi:hypothetical protein
VTAYAAREPKPTTITAVATARMPVRRRDASRGVWSRAARNWSRVGWWGNHVASIWLSSGSDFSEEDTIQ